MEKERDYRIMALIYEIVDLVNWTMAPCEDIQLLLAPYLARASTDLREQISKPNQKQWEPISHDILLHGNKVIVTFLVRAR